MTQGPGGGRDYGGPNPAGGPPNFSGWQQQPPPAGSGGWPPPSGSGGWPPPGGWQQPPPGPAPASGGWSPQPGYPGEQPAYPGAGWSPPPRRNRKPLIIAAAVGLVVVVVAAVVLAVNLIGSDSGDGPGSTTAGDTVKGYLEALARGDAEGALAFSDDQPGSKQFLTNDVLKKQLAKWPITNIRILSGDDDKGLGSLGFAQVHVVATFGDKTSDATMSIKKTNGRWHMDATAIKLTSAQSSIPDASARTLTLFGSPIGDGTAYVFPGWLDVASSNPYLGVTSQPLLLDALSTYPHRLDTQIKLADKGTKAVHDAITAAFASCQSSHLLAPPPPCPVAVRSSEGLPDGSLNWGVADLSQLQDGYFDSNGMTMSFSGKVTIPITSAGRLGSVDAYVHGKADLTTSPPSLNFKD